MELPHYLKSFIFFLALVIFPMVNCLGQVKVEWTFEQMFDDLSDNFDENTDLSELMERWNHFLQQPISINKTDGSELRELGFLSPLQIKAILDYRHVAGNFVHLNELQAIPELNEITILYLIPFLKIGMENDLQTLKYQKGMKQFDNEVMLKYGQAFQKSGGFLITDPKRSRYIGDPGRYAVRIRSTYANKIKLAVNMEKDAGEPAFEGLQRYGFDFYSASLSIRKMGVFNDIVIGDYALQFGQGLTMWNGLSFGKGALIQNVVRQPVNLRPYTSMYEANFMRGLASTVQFNNFAFTPYISFNQIDGNRRLVDDQYIIKTIAKTGLHRTPTELHYQKAIWQQVYGANLLYQSSGFKIGTHLNYSGWNGKIIKGNTLRNEHDFEGNHLLNGSIYGNYAWKNHYFFMESATSFDGGFAHLAGVISSLNERLSLVGIYRNYAKNFHSAHGNAFGDNSDVRNEKGIYAGMTYQMTRKWLWSSFVDFATFPWYKYQVDKEKSDGIDLFTQITRIWYKKAEISLRYRSRIKEYNVPKALSKDLLITTQSRHQLRFVAQSKLSKQWNSKFYAEAVNYSMSAISNEWGWLVFQDIAWQSSGNRISANGRLAFFNTDSYQSRIYAYESDVLYSSSIGLYYQKGTRAYVNLRLRVFKKADLWLKYLWTRYSGVSQIGSGLDKIDGNIKSDGRIQFRYKF